jgi:hypothetical protein
VWRGENVCEWAGMKGGRECEQRRCEEGTVCVKGSIWRIGAAPNPKDPPLEALLGLALAVAPGPNEKGLEADAEPANVHVLAAAASVAILKEGMQRTGQ